MVNFGLCVIDCDYDKEFQMEKSKVLITGGSGFIGTHLVDRLMQTECELVNIDINPPKVDRHISYWHFCDIKNSEDLKNIFIDFNPTHVIHLAAKANLCGKIVGDFPDNILGTANMVDCVNRSATVVKFIHASTQYVVRPGIWPENENFFAPYTAYGESKAEGERIVRQSCNKCWCILRPTNIWGPMHPFFPKELWQYLQKRYYVHPGSQPINKYYGYIDNAIDQIVAISFVALPDQVCEKVFYVTDPPIDNANWMNGFSMLLSGKSIHHAPIPVWRLFALAGDFLNAIGVKFPISSPRLFRLTVNEAVPYEKTIALVGQPSVTLDEGIFRSVEWYKSQADYHPVDVDLD
jgi:nucleoside-diphosphate-sugar epimerase